MIRLLIMALALWILPAGMAEAGPAFLAVLSAGGGLGAAFGATAVGGFLATTPGRLLASVALSALLGNSVPKARDPGITTPVTQTGGTNPVSFVLGTYATSGSAVSPPMSHGKAGKTPNAYLTYVVDLGDAPSPALDGLIIDGEFVTIGTVAHPDYGLPLTGRFTDFGWVKYYDGTQTAADPMLLAKYGTYPNRPWLADMIGRGVPYVILTFRYNLEVYSAFPTAREVSVGKTFYDPRLDSTVGGAGTHRWANEASWSISNNPAVQIYNILRGIRLIDGTVWGGGAGADDLPLSNWFAAMNSCDFAVALQGGGTEPRFRSGLEVSLDQRPADVVAELLKACAGKIVEAGGYWKIRVGGPGLPVYFFTDDDVLVTEPQELVPFSGLDGVINAVHASYPEPASIWEPKEAPARTNAAYEAQDQGQRRPIDLSLPAAPYKRQVQRLMRIKLEEGRKFLRHTLTLTPDAAILEPLDVVSWTSAMNGYAAKLFEVADIADDLMTLNQGVNLLEVDPADQNWQPDFELPSATTPGGIVNAAAQSLP
ncbi:MAG: phage tail protein, partial [Paracoccaceae bacterium]|nr:phage tail protein [Paracoccaceae bacterium]